MLRLQPGLGVRDLPLEAYESGAGEYMGAVAAEAFSNNPFMGLLRKLERDFEAGDIQPPPWIGPGDPQYEAIAEDRKKMLSRELSAKEANERWGSLGLKFTAPVRERVGELLAERKRELMAYHSVFDRARASGDLGFAKGALSVAADFLATLADPLNIASAFVPVVGPTRYAAWQARLGVQHASLAKGALEGAVGAALVEPINALVALDEQRKYTAAEALINIAFGAGAGGGLHWLIGPKRAPGEPAPPRGSVPSESAVPAGREDATLGRSEAASPEARPLAGVRQPFAEAIERLSPDTQEAALRTAVAQALQERRPDVEPILKADPAWRAPGPAVYAGPASRMAETRLDFNALRRDMLAAEAEIERLRAAAAEIKALAGGEQRGRHFAAPAEFKPTFKELNEARKFQAETWKGAGREPMRLMEYLTGKGIKPDTRMGDFLKKTAARDTGQGDLAAMGLDEKTRIKGKKLFRDDGRTLDEWGEHLGELAADSGHIAGFRWQGRRPDVNEVLAAIADDFDGTRPFYIDAAAGAEWRHAVEALERAPEAGTIAGQPIAGLAPRALAYLLRLDPLRRRLVELDDALARGAITEGQAVERAAMLDREMADAMAAEWAELRAKWNEYARELDPELVPEHPGQYVGQRPEAFDALDRSIRAHDAARERADAERALADAQGASERGSEPSGAHGEGRDAGRGEAQPSPDAGAEPRAPGPPDAPAGPGKAPKVDRTDQGDQFVLPGAERVAARALEGRAKGEAQQKGLEGLGLFDRDSRLRQADIEDFANRQQDPAADFVGARDPAFDQPPPKQDLIELERQTAELEARLGDRVGDVDRAAINERARAADDFLRAGEAYLSCKAED